VPTSSNTEHLPLSIFGAFPTDPAARVKWLLAPDVDELETLVRKSGDIARLCVEYEVHEARDKLARTDPGLDPAVREALAWRQALAKPDLRIFLNAHRTCARDLDQARRPHRTANEESGSRPPSP
jgi:hypothetical protein